MNRELRIIFVNGRQAHFTFRELLNLHLNPAAFGLLLLSFVVFHWAVPMPLIGAMAPIFKTVLWAKLIVLLFATYYLLVWVLRKRVIISPLLLAAGAVVLTAVANWFTGFMLNAQLPLTEAVFLAISVWVVCLLIEMIFVTANGPRLFATPVPSAPAAAPAEPPAAMPDLIIASERFDPAQISHITSEEHYLRIVLKGGTRHLRWHIADVEAQLPPALGLRVHRSHWVARAAVQGVERADPSMRLVLGCGAKIPVARGRQAEVRRWLDGA
jgi:hypothetical protein